MVRNVKMAALAGVLFMAATPAFAEDAMPLVIPPGELMTTVTTDFSKGVAEFNPTEILTPKPIEAAAPAASPAPKVKTKRYARKRKKLAKK